MLYILIALGGLIATLALAHVYRTVESDRTATRCLRASFVVAIGTFAIGMAAWTFPVLF